MSNLNVSDALIKFVKIEATADGDNEIVAAVAGKKIRVLSYVVVVTGGIAKFRDGAADTVRASYTAGEVSYPGGVYAPAFETASGQALEINNGVGVDTHGHLSYQEVAP